MPAQVLSLTTFILQGHTHTHAPAWMAERWIPTVHTGPAFKKYTLLLLFLEHSYLLLAIFFGNPIQTTAPTLFLTRKLSIFSKVPINSLK